MSYIDELFSSTIYSSLASSMIDQIWKYIYSAFKTFTILDMGLDNDFFFFFFRMWYLKHKKIEQMGLHQTEKPLHNKIINEWRQAT